MRTIRPFLPCFLVFCCLCFLPWGCGEKQEQTSPKAPTSGRAEEGSKPEVHSVQIAPDRATKLTKLQALVEGQRLKQPGVVLRYQWRANGKEIPGATDETLVPELFKKGDEIVVVVRPPSGDGQGRAVESKAVRIQNSPPKVKSATLFPETIFRGTPVQVKVEGFDPDGDEIVYAFQWILNGKDLEGSTGDRLEGMLLKRGDQISVRIVPSDGEQEGEPFTTGTVLVQNSPPQIVSNPPTSLKGHRLYTYPVQAQDPDGDPITYSLAASPSAMTIHPRTGTIQWTIPPGMNGDFKVEIVAEDGNGGKVVQSYILTVSGL